jgi:gluconokinase
VLELAAAVPAGSGGLVVLPYLLPERAPLWDPDLPGAYLGLRRDHTGAHMIRAALEGVCLQMRLIVDRLDEVAPVGSLRVTGGVFRSVLWREMMAAMLARPIHVVGDAEGTALGAAALGLFAIGRAPTLAAAVDAFGPTGDAADATVPPDPRLVEAYDELRASVRPLIAELGGVGELLR